MAQLPEYGIGGWILFIGVSTALPYRFGWRAIDIAHSIVAAFVLCSDLQWLNAEGVNPDWVGVPDMDFVFSLGLPIRIVVLNVLLFPVALAAIWIRKRKARTEHGQQIKVEEPPSR